MYFSYFDESGDDGFPKYSSELFVLTSIYFNYQYWKSNHQKIYQFRKELREEYGFPLKDEFHTKDFLQDKNLYHGKFSFSERKEILFRFFELVATLKMKIVNVVIDKTKISNPDYDVLRKALTYNIQRIENDLNSLSNLIKNPRFMIISDEGRLDKMREIAREIRRYNFIPTGYKLGGYRKEINNLIEDVFTKESSESWFIQIADMVSYIVTLYAKRHKCSIVTDWSNRVKKVLAYGDELALLEIIKPKLNLKASFTDPYGIVCYPK